jgi:hypothetical protein
LAANVSTARGGESAKNVATLITAIPTIFVKVYKAAFLSSGKYNGKPSLVMALERKINNLNYFLLPPNGFENLISDNLSIHHSRIFVYFKLCRPVLLLSMQISGENLLVCALP